MIQAFSEAVAKPSPKVLSRKAHRNTQPSEMRVMVIDDDPVFCELLRSWLGAAGYAVDLRLDGESALTDLRAGARPEAICLDLNLPGIGGRETLDGILEVHPRMPVVMLTSEGGVQHAVDAIKAGAFDYLTKPPAREARYAATSRAASSTARRPSGVWAKSTRTVNGWPTSTRSMRPGRVS